MNYNTWTEITDNPITVNFRGCQCVGDVHAVLKNTFGFPAYYGRNWSALWDCLWDFATDWQEDYLKIYILGMSSLPEETRICCNPMLSVLRDLQRDFPNVSVLWDNG